MCPKELGRSGSCGKPNAINLPCGNDMGWYLPSIYGHFFGIGYLWLGLPHYALKCSTWHFHRMIQTRAFVVAPFCLDKHMLDTIGGGSSEWSQSRNLSCVSSRRFTASYRPHDAKYGRTMGHLLNLQSKIRGVKFEPRTWYLGTYTPGPHIWLGRVRSTPQDLSVVRPEFDGEPWG